jgi:DNA polymerase I-like protein with 3'-5' exonuclease and polymerase domains
MALLNFIGNTKATTFSCSPFPSFMEWLKIQELVAFDTETNYVNTILERKLKVLSFSDSQESTTWVVQWEFLTVFQQKELCTELRHKLCVIHSVAFDYSVMKKHGVILEKVHDTMLAEQVLNNGYSSENSFFGLQAIMMKRYSIDISKAAQLTFGDTDEYDDEQIEYAAIDVIRLCSLRRIQLQEAKYFDDLMNLDHHKGLRKTMWWENEFVKCVADMEMTGVRFDKEKWYAIIDSVQPIYDEELATLNTLVVNHYMEVLLENDWYSKEDTFTETIWGSAQKKKLILEQIFDFEIEKTAIAELKKLLQEHDPDFPEGLKLTGKGWNESDYPTTFNSKYAVIKLLMLKKDPSVETALNNFLMLNLRDFCIEKGWLRPANTISLNWASPVQRLKIFQAIDPAIESTGAEVIIDFEHKSPVITHYLGWVSVEYQLKNFGHKFYDGHVQIDGKHRTRFNQILKTGRLSSVKPNLLNIPRKHEAYRAALIPDPGFELIDADYESQELVIVANLAGEQSWLDYLKKGYDLHSKNAELIFGDEWVDATEDGCTYYGAEAVVEGVPMLKPLPIDKPYKKCKCKGHVEMRDNSKAVSFGSVYGISYFKLAFNLKISEERAKFILHKFFEIVPNIKLMMEKFGSYALQEGHIMEPVLGRMRFFDKWKLAVPSEQGAVMRAAFNTPIQSSGSAILKIAFVLLRRWINHNNHQDNIQLLMPYHDECIAQARPAYVTLAKEKVEHYMMLAASLSGFKINASAKSGMSWLEAH